MSSPPYRVAEHPFTVAALGSLALLAVTLTLFTPRYQTCDDAIMNLIAAGVAVGDAPDEHLLFTNVALGLPLKWLYAGAPAVPWYGTFQLATLTLSAAALAYALLRVCPTAGQLAAVGLILAVVVMPCMVTIQFTKTAFLASFAGLTLFLAPLWGCGRWPRRADVAAGALLVLGSLVRFEGFLLAGVAALPAAAAGVAAGRGAVPDSPRHAGLAAALRRALPVAAASALALVLFAGNRAWYAADDWSEFYAYNTLRANFTDYHAFQWTPEAAPAFDAAGWSRLDLEMMNKWFFADRERFGLAKLREVAATVPRAPRPSPRAVTSAFFSQALPREPDLLRLTLAAFCVPLLAGGGWRRLLLAAVLLALASALTIALRWSLYVPLYVAFSAFAAVPITLALRAKAGDPPHAGRRFDGVLRLAAGLTAGALVVWVLAGLGEASGVARERRADMERLLSSLKPRPDRLFVSWSNVLPFEDMVDPVGGTQALRPFRCLPLLYTTGTPLSARRLHDFGITDLCEALPERRDVCLFASPELINLYLLYYCEHHQGVVPPMRLLFARQGLVPAFVYQGARLAAPPPEGARSARPAGRPGGE